IATVIPRAARSARTAITRRPRHRASRARARYWVVRLSMRAPRLTRAHDAPTFRRCQRTRRACAANATRLPFGARARPPARPDAAPSGIGATLKPDRRRGQVARMKRRASERRPGAAHGAHSAEPGHEHAVTVRDIVERKGARDRIVCVTAY